MIDQEEAGGGVLGAQGFEFVETTKHALQLALEFDLKTFESLYF